MRWTRIMLVKKERRNRLWKTRMIANRARMKKNLKLVLMRQLLEELNKHKKQHLQ